MSLLAACGDDGAAAGEERGPCRDTEPACDGALVCRSEICVEPDGQADGGQPGGDSATSSGDGMSTMSNGTGDSMSGGDSMTAGNSDSDPSAGDEAGEVGGQEDRCPITPAQLDCQASCAAEIAWDETCDDGLHRSMEDCVFGCEYAKDNGLLEPINLEWSGCLQMTGGANCDAVTQCLFDAYCG